MNKSHKSKGIYFAGAILPNLITMLNLFSGFLSMIMAMTGHYYWAVWMIFIGLIWDSLDGHVARIFDNPTDFGKELDSLADIVSFVAAPCFLVTKLIFLKMSPWMLFTVFIYLSAGAYRLARFNIRPAVKGYFEGLPTPASAMTFVSTVLACYQNQWADYKFCEICVAAMMVVLSYLMTSNVHYPKFSANKFSSWQSFLYLDVAVVAVNLIFMNVQTAMAGGFLFYLIFSPIYALKTYEPVSREA